MAMVQPLVQHLSCNMFFEELFFKPLKPPAAGAVAAAYVVFSLLQCCAGAHLPQGAAQHVWHTGLYPMYNRFSSNRAACTSREAN
jgi:hypothetical protein